MPPNDTSDSNRHLVESAVDMLVNHRFAAPLNILAAAGVLTIGATMLIVALLSQSVWLGVLFQPDPANRGLIVQKVFPGSPGERAGLSKGDSVSAIAAPKLGKIALSNEDIIEDPGLMRTYAHYHRFFDKQKALSAALVEGPVEFLLGNGEIISIKAASTRPIGSLPWTFWFQIICASVSFLAGAVVGAFRRNDPAARYYSMTGVGIALVIFSNVYFSSRELTLNADLFLAASKLNWLGVCTLGLGLIGTLWYYPKRISNFPFSRMLAGIYVLAFCWDFFEIPETLDAGQRYPLYLGFVTAAGMAIFQWFRLRDDPVSRASMRWFFFSWFAGTGAFIGLVLLPISLGGKNVNYTLAIGLLPLLQLGIALGILRYRLFDLDRLAMNIWLWFIGGLLVIVLDALLIYSLNINTSVALSLSLLFVGWVYFPLRQGLWKRLGWNPARVQFEQVFPDLLKSILSLDAALPAQERWFSILQELYRPLSIKSLPHTVDKLQRSDDGLSIQLPEFPSVAATEIYGADRGTRLFGPRDEIFLHALWRLFNETQLYRDAFEHGVIEERERVARDLHDDIAGDLLGLIYKAPDQPTRQLAHKIFEELRVIIQGMESSSHSLDENLIRWRDDTFERCSAAGIALDWDCDDVSDIQLPPRNIVNLRRAIREAVSNVIRHSNGDRLHVNIRHEASEIGNRIAIDIVDNGDGFAVGAVRGRGISNITNRVQELDGRAEWVTLNDDQNRSGTCLHIHFPIPSNANPNISTNRNSRSLLTDTG